MAEKLRNILETEFDNINIDVEEMPNGRFSGSVVWAGFAGMDDIDRQNKIRNVLKRDLGPEVQLVGVLLTYTPDELTAMSAA